MKAKKEQKYDFVRLAVFSNEAPLPVSYQGRRTLPPNQGLSEYNDFSKYTKKRVKMS